MWILMLEAGVAFFLLVFIVWWTMYQGKDNGKDQRKDQGKKPARPISQDHQQIAAAKKDGAERESAPENDRLER